MRLQADQLPLKLPLLLRLLLLAPLLLLLLPPPPSLFLQLLLAPPVLPPARSVRPCLALDPPRLDYTAFIAAY